MLRRARLVSLFCLKEEEGVCPFLQFHFCLFEEFVLRSPRASPLTKSFFAPGG